MEEFFAEEIARFNADPVMRAIGYVTFFSLLGFPVAKKFDLDWGIPETSIRVFQAGVTASATGIFVSLSKPNPTLHVFLWLAGFLFLYSIALEKWTKLPQSGNGFFTMLIVYIGVTLAMAESSSVLGAMAVATPFLIVGVVVGFANFYEKAEDHRKPPSQAKNE